MWVQLRIIQGGHLKIGGTGKNSNMRGHTKFLGGLKNRGGKAFRGPVTEGCIYITRHKACLSSVYFPDGAVDK